ncbi:MAG: histidinol dehydrogenase [Candidatus Omnitrophica bacterium]|nr:histidinol dehydrogenase [Candidatus Omnitrophota bacterium]
MFQKLCDRNLQHKKRVQETVRKIIEDVKNRGDEALIKYTGKFDKVKLQVKKMRVTEGEMNGAYQNIKEDFIDVLKMALDNVSRFYKRQLPKSWKVKDREDGTVLVEKFQPLESIGMYVPGGTAPLVSTVYMTVVPARIAGVNKVVMCTPPNKFGTVDPHILAVANLLNVNEVYKVGGAQAIAAMALGTKTIPKVDKVVGPGNQYVTEAKRQIYGFCDIDMLAGPSEIAIIANQYSNPDYVIADLRAQSEHLMGLSILVTTSKRLARFIKKEVSEGYIVLVKNLDEAVEVVNRIAPEHLSIMVKSPNRIVSKIKSSGAIFLGPYSPVVVGDYIAGPSHVLPTGGSARFSSGLSIYDFIKRQHVISYSKKALEKVNNAVQMLAALEGLEKHLESVRVRFEK